MEFRILGPLEVIDGDRPLELGTAKERTLLGLLLLRANRAVSVDQLAEELWSGEPPARASANLRVHVSHLRKALGGGDGVVVTRRPGYLVQVGPDDLDAVRFEQLAAAGREQLGAGDAEAARHSLEEALALWRGPVLADLELSEADHPELARLAEARLSTIEDRMEAALACGRHGDVVGELEGLVAEHPLRERLWAQRMLALYRAGRQAEALRCYQELRTTLGEELGIDPSPALQDLEQAILLQKPELELGSTSRISLPPVAEAPLPTGPVTFFLTDIAGSTALWERHPDAMAQALSRHDALITTVVEEHRGHLVKKRGEGDATFSVFVRPTDAVAAAVEAQRRLHAEHWPGGLAIRVRAALHTGEAELRDDDYFGGVVNRVARLRAVAHGGQVIVSGATAELVRDILPDGVSLKDLGTHRLRDLSRPERVWQLGHLDLSATFPPLKSLDAMPTNLPATTTSFVGREQELERVAELLGLSRLVTLTGAGGSGKTRLALRAGADALDRNSEGVWLVELAPVGEPDLVPQAVAAALGVHEESGRDMTEAIVDDLSSKHVLLILDNCEHVIAAAATLVDALLARCPQLTVLATSRERLNIAGESTWPVPPLEVPEDTDLAPDELLDYEAVRLFVDRAAAVSPRFLLGPDNVSAVVDICRRLDGIPLAIELAAARVALLTPTQIAERLEDRFRLLTSGSRAALPRQQTLRALVDWSHDLLGDDERMLFRRLGVFRGGFTLETAEKVATGDNLDPIDVFDLVAQLVDKSLVVVDRDASPPRYTLLETMREYAEARLEEAGELGTVRRRHVDWCVTLAETAMDVMGGGHQGVVLHALEAEHDNLRAALDWCLTSGQAGTALHMTAMLWPFWYVRAHWIEARRWLSLALELATDGELADRASSLAGAALFTMYQGGAVEGERLAREAVAAAEQAGDDRTYTLALGFVGQALQVAYGDRATAIECYRQVIAVAEERNVPQVPSLARFWLGHARLADSPPEDDPEYPRRLFQQVLEEARQRNDRWLMSLALHSLAGWSSDDGENKQLLAEALELAREVGEPETEASLAMSLAGYALADGDLDTALHAAQEAMVIHKRLRRPEMVVSGMAELLTILRLRGDRGAFDAALEEIQAIAGAERIATERNAIACWQRGLFALADGNVASAAADLLRATYDLEAKGHPLVGMTARAIAVIAARLGDGVAAARIWGICEGGTLELLNRYPVFRLDHMRELAEIEAALPPEQYEVEKAIGAQMSLREAGDLCRQIVEQAVAAANT